MRTPALSAAKSSHFLSYFWSPGVICLIIPIWEIVSSTHYHYYAHYAYFAHNFTLNLLADASFLFAGVLTLIPPLRSRLAYHLDKLSTAPFRIHLAWGGVTYGGILAWFSYVKFCQYRAYLLPTDTTNDINSAYVFLHHGVLEYPIWGLKVLSIHFSLLSAVFAPFLVIYKSPLTLLFVQNIFICSVPLAMYCLIFFLTSSSMAGAAGMLTTLSSPYLYELLTSNLNAFNASLCCFLPWAMFFLYLKRWWLVAVIVVLMICEKEQVPFIFFGMGLFAIYALRQNKPWNWVWGLLICAASIGLWVGEMALIAHYDKNLDSGSIMQGVSAFSMFKHLVPAETPTNHVLPEIIGHPFRTTLLIFSSRYRFYPLLRVLFSVGFLCFFAPMHMLPFWTAILPHVMAAPGTSYQFFEHRPGVYFDFGLHHSAYFFGPLVWATAHGIENIYRKLSARKQQSWLLVWVLFFGGFGFKYAHRTLDPKWLVRWFDPVPRVMSQIPPNSRIWVMEYLSAPLSTRRWIKIIGTGPGAPSKYLFKPDYVLWDKAYVLAAEQPYRDQMLTFLANNNYQKIAEDGTVFLLKAPSVSPKPDDDIEEWIQLPDPDSKTASAYIKYLGSF